MSAIDLDELNRLVPIIQGGGVSVEMRVIETRIIVIEIQYGGPSDLTVNMEDARKLRDRLTTFIDWAETLRGHIGPALLPEDDD